MNIFTQRLNYETTTQIDFVNITDDVRDVVTRSNIVNGHVVVFVEHTTLGIAINHDEPMLLQDFARMLQRIVPAETQYAHDIFELRRGGVAADGRSNGHSHCKALLLGTSEYVPLIDGAITLSPLQSIFMVDMDGPRRRDVLVQVIGMPA